MLKGKEWKKLVCCFTGSVVKDGSGGASLRLEYDPIRKCFIT